MDFFKRDKAKKGLRLFVLSLITAGFLSGCGVYSFTGGAIPPEVNSISIENFFNESAQGPPNLSQVFTEKLRSYYQQNSRLAIVKSNGDWQMGGRIISYLVSPVAPREGETAALSRLTITVQVVFNSNVDKKADFEQPFSFYADFDQNQSLAAVENELIQTITDQIVFDIFTKTTSNW
jgi:hypothetical protein